MRLRLEAERGELQEKSKELLRAVAARIAYVDDSALDLIEKANGERPDPLDQIPVIKEILDRVHVAYGTHVHSMVSEIEQMMIREGLFKKANGDEEEDDAFMGFTPQVFDGEHMHQIRESVQRHHDSLIASFAGPQALPANRRAAVMDADQDDKHSPIELAFLFGLLLAHSGNSDRVKDMSYSAFEDAVRQGSIRLPDKDRQEIRALEMEAGQRLQHLGSEVALAASLVAADAMRGIDNRKAAERLRSASEKWSDRWDRLARSVLHTARDRGAVARYKIGDLAALDTTEQESEGTDVYRQTRADACPYCDALYNGPDGQPRIFKLSVLESNGTNAGRGKSAWMPVIGATHPHCRCTTHPVPAGMGFNDVGELVEGGTYGIRHDTEKSFLHSYVGEQQLQKSFRTLEEISFQGLSVEVDSGDQTQARMPYTHGAVRGVAKSLRCFVGPDPYPEKIYVIRKNNPRTGCYDEDKVMLGFTSPHHAKSAFLQDNAYDEDTFGSIVAVSIEEFARSLHGAISATETQIQAEAAPSKKGPPLLKSKSSLRLTIKKGGYSSQSIAAESNAEDRNPSGGSGLDIKEGTIFPAPTHPAKPNLEEVAGMFEGAVLTEEEIQHLMQAGTVDRKELLDDAGYRERDVKPVKIPDEYAMLADPENTKENGKKVQEYMQAWVDERGEPEINAIPQRTEKAMPLSPGQCVTVKKRKFGSVTLKVLDKSRFGVQLPKEDKVLEFDSLSAACDHVWVVSKGYDSADAYKQDKGVTKVPSGAGWRFWGINPKEVTVE